MSRGRQPMIPPLTLQTILDKYREEIYDESTGKTVPKAHKIWETISSEVLQETGIVKSARALYTHVTCRKVFAEQRPTENVASEGNLDNTVESEANTSAKEDTRVIQIHFAQNKFEEIIGERDYNDRKTKSGKRTYDVFIEGKWEHAMTELLWEESRIACGFQYSRGRLYRNNTATIHGKCKCGMKIECAVADTKRDTVIVTCILSGKSQGQCSRRPLRNPQRDDLAKQMLQTGKAASKIYREMAKEFMVYGDKIPPHLYEPQILADGKYKYLCETQLHRDPLTSLISMKSGPHKNSIHDVGVSPFFVYYLTSQQLYLYIEYVKSNETDANIVIDATGRVVRNITRPDGTISGHIFLYAIVIYWNGQQIMVYQMLSESHDALHISNWLRYWLYLGAPPPKEVTSDDGKAIIIAEINAFTQYRTITEYSNACFQGKEVPCFIRIDNAHFIKNYAILLKGRQVVVKRLLLAAVGQVILARSLTAAGEILKHIFFISMSTSGGKIDNDEMTECSKSVAFLKHILTINKDTNFEAQMEKAIQESDVSEEKDITLSADNHHEQELLIKDEQPSDECGQNLYHEWAQEIYDQVVEITSNQIGCDPNPYEFKPLAKKLLRDCKELAMWSNVVRDSIFGYGQVPASSAIVESEFNNLKTRTLGKKTRLRIDDFVKTHLDDITGSNMVVAGKRRCRDDNNTRQDSDDEMRIERTSNSPNPIVEDEIYVGNSIGTSNSPNSIIIENTEPDNDKVMSWRQTEKWGGLENKENNTPNKRTKRSFYMGNTFREQDLTFRNCRTEWPIIKNANNLRLKPHIINGTMFLLSQTCSFDSLSQIMLKVIDEPTLKKEVASWNTKFAKFLINLHDKNVTSNTYKTRTEILVDIVPKSQFKTSGRVVKVACDMVAAELTNKLLEDNSFAEQHIKCNNCGYQKIIKLQTLSIQDYNLKLGLADAINIYLQPETSPCEEPCRGYRRSETTLNSDMMFLDIFTQKKFLEPVRINDIPMSLSIKSETYHLQGIVDFEYIAEKRTRTATAELATSSQHFTALLPLKNHTDWIKIDDMESNIKKLKKKSIVIPIIMVYAKV